MYPQWIVATLTALLLGGCASQPARVSAPPPADDFQTFALDDEPATRPAQDGAPLRMPTEQEMRDASPRSEPLARYGNHSPYEVLGKRYHVMPTARGYAEEGIASWYGTKFQGQPTSTLEPYDLYAMTAAHKSLPLPSYVRVTNLDNRRSVVVRVNDRGPFMHDRIIDLSYAAAVKLGYHLNGTARVKVEAITFSDTPTLAMSRPASTAAPSSGNTELFLQAGAFLDEGAAQQLRSRLADLLNAPVRVLPRNEGSHYRVHAGPFRTEADARSAQTRIREAQLGNPMLIRR